MANLLIYNPKAKVGLTLAQQKRVIDHLNAYLKKQNLGSFDLMETQAEDHKTYNNLKSWLAQNPVGPPANKGHWIAIAGGDGTVSKVINHLIQLKVLDLSTSSLDQAQGVRIIVFPCGTGNDWFKTLSMGQDLGMGYDAGLKLLDLGRLTYRPILQIKAYSKDQVAVKTAYALNGASFGLTAKVALNLAHAMGKDKSSYIKNVLLGSLSFNSYHLTLTDFEQDLIYEGPLSFAVLALGGYSGGGVLWNKQRAKGLLESLDLVLVKQKSKLHLLRHIPELLWATQTGLWHNINNVVTDRVQNIVVESRDDLGLESFFEYDGNELSYKNIKKIEIQVLPGILPVISINN